MSGPSQPPLTVETVDGTTSGRPITTIKVTNGDLTVSGSTATIDTSGGGGGGGTVTSVGSPQAFITITSATTTPSISIGNASGAATGVLTASDFNTFDAKQDAITLTTTGTSGAATFSAGTLNIPQYSGGGGGGIGGSISDNQVAVGASTSDEIEGYSDFTYNDSTDTLTVGEKITASGTTQLQLLAGSSNISILDGGVANHINITPASGTMNLIGSNLRIGTSNTTITTRGAYDLTLNTNDGTNSGSIVIADGVDGQISITPNGAGTIKLDGVELDNSAIQTGYVLKATSATAMGWAAESGGGGSPGGSDTMIQYNNGGSFGGSSVMTFDDTAAAEQLLISSSSSTALLKIEQTGAGNAFEVHDATAPDSNRFEIDQYGRASVQGTAGTSGASLYVGGNISTAGRVRGVSGTAASPSYSNDTDTNTGIFFPAADEIGFSNNSTETLRFGSSGEILIGGSAAGTAGQVLTSGGASAAVSWTTVSGGSAPPLMPPWQPKPSPGTGDNLYTPTYPFSTNIGGSSQSLGGGLDKASYYPFYIGANTKISDLMIKVASDSTDGGSPEVKCAIYTVNTIDDEISDDSVIGTPKAKISGSDASFAVDNSVAGERRRYTYSSTLELPTANTWYVIGIVGSQAFTSYPSIRRNGNSTIGYSPDVNYQGWTNTADSDFDLPASYSAGDTNWATSSVFFYMPSIYYVSPDRQT